MCIMCFVGKCLYLYIHIFVYVYVYLNTLRYVFRVKQRYIFDRQDIFKPFIVLKNITFKIF